jgi:hypothetical protein
LRHNHLKLQSTIVTTTKPAPSLLYVFLSNVSFYAYAK